MRTLLTALVTSLLLGIGPGLRGSTERVLVIVHPANPLELSESEIRNIYSDRMARWPDGKPVRLYELPARSLVREHFYQKLLGISARRSASEWNNRKITNTLKSLPPSTRRESTLISAVAREETAIGYVSESALHRSDLAVRVVHRLE